MAKELTLAEEIGRTVFTRFRKELWSPFVNAIHQYELIQPGDHIAVCISGGKDSMLMAKLMQMYQGIHEIPFEVTYLVMDPGYNEFNRKKIEENAKTLDIPITIFETNIFAVANNQTRNPCYLCARMRRGHLYNAAKNLGCNKIALGHHLNDAIETVVMAMLNSSKLETIIPKARSENFEGMELIRPMYFVREDDIKAWRDYHGLHFIQCACHFTDTCSSCRDDGVSISKRMETKKLIRKLKETNPYVESNIFNSTKNVCLDTLLSYKQKGVTHNFLDTYNETGTEETIE